MVNYLKFFAQSLVLLFFWSCKPKNIILPKSTGLTNQLRIDGFYYQKVNPKNDAVKVIFLYKNGVVLDLLTFEKLDIQAIRNHIKEYYDDNRRNDNRLSWGIFDLKNLQISVTNWYPSSGGPLPVYVQKGVVLNDTTFVMNRLEKTNGKKIEDINSTYKFVQFSPKPDSTNTVLK